MTVGCFGMTVEKYGDQNTKSKNTKHFMTGARADI